MKTVSFVGSSCWGSDSSLADISLGTTHTKTSWLTVLMTSEADHNSAWQQEEPVRSSRVVTVETQESNTSGSTTSDSNTSEPIPDYSLLLRAGSCSSSHAPKTDSDHVSTVSRSVRLQAQLTCSSQRDFSQQSHERLCWCVTTTFRIKHRRVSPKRTATKRHVRKRSD